MRRALPSRRARFPTRRSRVFPGLREKPRAGYRVQLRPRRSWSARSVWSIRSGTCSGALNQLTRAPSFRSSGWGMSAAWPAISAGQFFASAQHGRHADRQTNSRMCCIPCGLRRIGDRCQHAQQASEMSASSAPSCRRRRHRGLTGRRRNARIDTDGLLSD